MMFTSFSLPLLLVRHLQLAHVHTELHYALELEW